MGQTNGDFFWMAVALGMAMWGGIFYFAYRLLGRAGSGESVGFRLGRFMAGGSGLPKTFWLYYVLVSNIAFAALYLLAEPGSPTAITGLVAFLLYFVFVSVAVWQSASGYGGFRLWAWLAKAQVLTPVLGVVIALAITAATR